MTPVALGQLRQFSSQFLGPDGSVAEIDARGEIVMVIGQEHGVWMVRHPDGARTVWTEDYLKRWTVDLGKQDM